MKLIHNAIISFCILLSLFAQPTTDTVYLESEIILNTSNGNIYGTLTITKNTKRM